MLVWDAKAAQWLFFEGLIPLFGASILCVFIGAALWLNQPKGVTFNFKWTEAIDPIGWLYAGAVLVMQTWSVISVSENRVKVPVLIAGVATLLVLSCGLVVRSQNPGWKPPRRLQAVALLLTFVILLAGYMAKAVEHRDSKSKTTQTEFKV